MISCKTYPTTYPSMGALRSYPRNHPHNLNLLLLAFTLLHFALSAILLPTASACSTIVAGKNATDDGSVIFSHSNDGAGDAPGNIHLVVSANYTTPSTRSVSRGSIPQVPSTFQYLTEGYAIMNENQVGLGESTCHGIYTASSGGGILNIVDLGQIALERSKTALEAVKILGQLAEKFGYYDNAESLMVTDPTSAYIFHVLSDSTGNSAIWAALKVPDDHVATVMNAFVIRAVDLSQDELFSKNLLSEAEILSWQPNTNTPLDFTLLFSKDNEATCKYTSGRRQWAVLNELAPSLRSDPEYVDYVTSGYPATFAPDIPNSINVTVMSSLMRNTFQNTPFDMALFPELSGGPWKSPSRWTTPQAVDNATVCWERPIAIFRSIVSLVGSSSSESNIGGTVWFGPHSALTTIYVPFSPNMNHLPISHTNNSLSSLNRNVSAFWASRFLYQVSEIKSEFMLADIRIAQSELEAKSLKLQEQLAETYDGDVQKLTDAYSRNALDAVSAWWAISDTLVMRYADGYCDGCGHADVGRDIGYDQDWLNSVVPRKKKKMTKTQSIQRKKKK